MATDPGSDDVLVGGRLDARILAAAVREFSEHGLAGARIDRVAAGAGTSKARIYARFRSKSQLFDHVIETAVVHQPPSGSMSIDELVDWAVQIYDRCLERPDLARLEDWARLECRLSDVQIFGGTADGASGHVAAMVRASARAMASSDSRLRADSDPSRRGRELLRDTVRRAFMPENAGSAEQI